MSGSSVFAKIPCIIIAVFLSAVIIFNCSNQDRSLEPLPGSPAGGVIAGAVRSDDAAIADATVRLEPVVDGIAVSVAERIAAAAGAPDGAVGATASAGIRVTISDSHGRYAFDGLEAGEYLLVTQAKDHLAGSALAVLSKDAAAAAGTTFVDIELMPTGTFAGNATLQNMTDHSSTIVYVTGSSNVAVTDAAGDYELSGVPVGDHMIQATHTGWIDQTAIGSIMSAGDSIVLESIVLPRDANMPPEVTIVPLPLFPAQNIHAPIPFEATAEDPDGTIELIEWDFEDDGIFDLADPSAYIAYYEAPDTGSYRVKVRVTDDKGAIGLAVLNYHVTDAIYVSGVDGDDGFPGTAALPVQTIQQGITLAEPQGLTVLVNSGSYWEAVQFKSNVPVWGGYNREAGWTKAPGSYSQIWLQSYYHHVALAYNVTNTTIRGMEIQAETAQGDGASAIALILDACDSTLVFEDCRIIAGSATAALTAGTNGTPGISGGPGESGLNGCNYDLPGCGTTIGGAGGDGAVEGGRGGQGGFYAAPLQDGFAGYGPAGGSGGASAWGCTNTPGDGGNATANGTNGADGNNAAAAAMSYGTISGYDWTGATGLPGFNGQDGQEGSGGGGGGAIYEPSQCNITGASGGGGGGSGGGGSGGGWGNTGGASIAVLCIGSTATFNSCLIQTGNGGNGWRGGNGGAGGAGGGGGAGGTGYWYNGVQSGDGGDGSNGGNGGGGGAGSGGPGGPSIGIYNFGGSVPILVDITWSIGAGGAGGPGGTHGSGSPQAPAGPAGPSAQIYNHP